MNSSTEEKTSNANATPPSPREASAEPAAVGEWPVPAPKWGLIASAVLWIAWLGFLVWMMILRLQATGAKPE